jgi:hypothetical protein
MFIHRPLLLLTATNPPGKQMHSGGALEHLPLEQGGLMELSTENEALAD